ncbi:hypothetical protein TNCV_1218771 [Trichonephila clavipes]|nr:hypothetical protein TNCV_1218771 [Trichonephila clavipes]
MTRKKVENREGSLGYPGICYVNITVVVSFPDGRKETCLSLRQVGLLGSTTILRKNTLKVVRGFSPLFTFHQPHEKTCGSLAILSSPIPQKHYTFTNIHTFSRIRTQALRHRGQRH